MSVNVINLRRRADRREAMLAECERVGVDPVFIEAVDGENVDVPDWWRGNAGMYACYFSHLALLREAVDAGDRSDLIVLEDDVLFDTAFVRKLDAHLDAQVRPWDVLYLGGRPLRPQAGSSGLRKVDALLCTWGYVVSGEYVAQHYYDLLNVTRAIDIYLLEQQPRRRFYLTPEDLVRPNPALAGRSDIREVTS